MSAVPIPDAVGFAQPVPGSTGAFTMAVFAGARVKPQDPIFTLDQLEAYVAQKLEQHKAKQGGSVVDAMHGYLRVCSCGGMTRHKVKQILAAVKQADRLGYFDNLDLSKTSDSARLTWAMNEMTEGHRVSYAAHVLSRGGNGDLGDIRTFIDGERE